jgi:hypothetical protein
MVNLTEKVQGDMKKIPLSYLLVAATIILVVILRLLWICNIPVEPTSDFLDYFNLGRELLQKGVYERNGLPTAYRPPGYPLFLCALFWFTGPSILAAKVANVFMAVIYTIVLFFLGRQSGKFLSGNPKIANKIGLSAALFYAISPNFIFTSALIASENLFSPLLAAGLLLLVWENQRLGTGDAFNVTAIILLLAAGLCLGAASLCRAIALLLPIVFLIWYRITGVGFKTAFIRVILVCGGMAIAVLPWTIRNYVIFQKFVPISTNGGANFYVGHNPTRRLRYYPKDPGLQLVAKNEIEMNREGYKRGWEYISKHKSETLMESFKKLELLFSTSFRFSLSYSKPGIGALTNLTNYERMDLLYNMIVIHDWYYYFLFFGSIVALFYPGQMSVVERLIWLVFLYWVLIHIVFFAKGRFRFPIETLMPLIVANLVWGKMLVGRNKKNKSITIAKAVIK